MYIYGDPQNTHILINWYPVVVEVADLVPESIPERVQYANMEDWRTVNPVKRSASLFINVP